MADANSIIPVSKENFLYMKILALRCGIDLTEYNVDALYNRITRRIRQLSLSDCDAYCQKLRSDLEEEEQFINLITNSTTFFFRENHHFDYLAKHLLPALIAKKRKIRIWCAGCSTGEEAYSIAMIVRESVPNINQFDIKILATDVNSSSLLDAEKGIYEVGDIQSMTTSRKKRWFVEVNDKGKKLVEVSLLLKELITFNQLNLLEKWPIKNKFDIVFCRNVMIYFKKDAIKKVLEKFHDVLEDGGILFLGHSESLDNNQSGYKLLGKSIYEKSFFRRVHDEAY